MQQQSLPRVCSNPAQIAQNLSCARETKGIREHKSTIPQRSLRRSTCDKTCRSQRSPGRPRIVQVRCLLQAPTAHGTTNSARAAIKKAKTMRDFALHSFGGKADSQTAAPPLAMMANTEECLVHRSNSEAEDLLGYTVKQKQTSGSASSTMSLAP